MSVNVALAPATPRHLEGEGPRRGVGVDVVISEFAETVPTPTEPHRPTLSRRANFDL